MPEDTMIAEAPVSESVETSSAPETSTETVETPETVETEVSTDAAKPTETEDVTDGRTIPSKYRELFKQHPELRNQWFQNREMLKIFPQGVKQAQELHTKLEQMGGFEGIQQQQQEFEAARQEWDNLDRQYDAADPQFIKNIAAENKEAFTKLMPTALDTLYETDPAQYSHLMARVVVATLDKSPLASVYQMLNSKEETKSAAAELAKWYDGIEKLSQQVPVKKVDPEQEKFQQEKQTFEQQKQKEFEQSINTENYQANTRTVDSVLAREFQRVGQNLEAFKKSNPDGYRLMLKNSLEGLTEILSADTEFNRRLSAIVQTKDRAKATRFVQSTVAQKAPDIVTKIFRAFTKGAAKPMQKAVVPQNGQRTQPVIMSKQPGEKDIDWNRTTSDMVLAGKAFVKGRKEQVSW